VCIYIPITDSDSFVFQWSKRRRRTRTRAGGYGHQFLGCRVAHDVPKLVLRGAPKEQEPIAGIQEVHALDPRQLRREEGEGRVDWRSRFSPPRQAGEVPIAVTLASTTVEETFQGLGQLLAVEGVGDEVAPGFGHARGTAEVLDGQAREDIHHQVVAEPRHRRPLCAVHTAGSGEGMRRKLRVLRRIKVRIRDGGTREREGVRNAVIGERTGCRRGSAAAASAPTG